MLGNAISSVLMGYTPLIDKQRNTIGMRVPVVASTDGSMPPLDRLYQEFSKVEIGVPPLLLAVEGDRISPDVLRCKADPNIWLEVPAPFACSAEGGDLVMELMQAGFRMVLRGRPPAPLAPRLLPAFQLALIDYSEDRRIGESRKAPPDGSHQRAIPYAQSGVKRIDEMEAAFTHGAVSCIGWPWDDALEQASKRAANPDFSTITEMISLIDSGADVSDLERVLRRDASLA